MFDVAVEQIVKVKPPKTAVVLWRLQPYHRQEHLE